jgi:hypothetical protein
MIRSDPYSKGWFSVKRILGMLISIGAMAVLLGTLTGCPDSAKKTTDKKTETEVKKDATTTKTTEDKKTEETTKKKDS